MAAVDELISLAGSGGASSPVDELVALAKPAGPPVTGNPNADARDLLADPARQRAIDTQTAGPSWYRNAMANNPNAAKLLRPTLDPILAPNVNEMKAGLRGAAVGALGSLGDLENFGANTTPNMLGSKTPDQKTLFPTSNDVSRALTTFGIPENPAYKDYSESGQLAGGMLIPGAATLRGGEATEAAIANRLGRSAQQSREIAGQVRTAANEGIERLKAGALEPVPGAPVATEASRLPVPPQRAAARVSPMTTSDELKAAIQANDARLSEAKTAAYNKFAETLPTAPAPDIEPLKETLRAKMRDAGTADARNAYEKLLNDLSHVEQESQTKFQAYDQIRRQLSQKAKFGEEVSGYGAIAANEAKDAARQLGDAMKEAHPPYAEYTKKYSDLSRESQPAGAKFLAGVKAKEGGDLMKAAMRSTDNVNTAIEAMGGDRIAFDRLAMNYVRQALEGKSGPALERAVIDMEPSLQRLPGARAAAQDMLNERQLEEAFTGLAARAEKIDKEAFTGAMGRQKNAQAAHDAAMAKARSYEPYLLQLQKDIPTERRVSLLRSTAKKMFDDGLIDEAKLDAFQNQINAAYKSVDRDKALGTAAKYLLYASGAGYLVSFGGPHLVKVLTP